MSQRKFKPQGKQLALISASICLLLIAGSQWLKESHNSSLSSEGKEGQKVAGIRHRSSTGLARTSRLRDRSTDSEKKPSSQFSQFVGLQITGDVDDSQRQEWATKLSANPHQERGRLHDLNHVRRAKVVDFEVSEDKRKELHNGPWPVRLAIPSFDGETDAWAAVSRADMESATNGTLFASLEEDSDTSVVLVLQDGYMTGMIEALGKRVHFDSLDLGINIIRELDAEASIADFKCAKCESGEH